MLLFVTDELIGFTILLWQQESSVFIKVPSKSSPSDITQCYK